MLFCRVDDVVRRLLSLEMASQVSSLYKSCLKAVCFHLFHVLSHSLCLITVADCELSGRELRLNYVNCIENIFG